MATSPNPEILRTALRMAEIRPFHVVEILQRAQALRAAGRSIVHMEVGEPDFPTAEPLIEAAAAFLRHGHVHYTSSLGLWRLREAIAGHYAQRYGITVVPERIIVTSGASGALLLAMAALIDPGREVLLTDPGYPCNRNFVRAFEGIPRSLPVSSETAFQPTAEQVDRAWNGATRALLVASPANPTGTLIDGQGLAALWEAVSSHGGCLLVDEIYHGLTYGCEAATALAIADDIFVINSFSKYFGMTGWRLGWLVAPAACVRDIEKLAQNLYISPSAPAQHAALAAFGTAATEIFEARRAEFAARRDFLLPALESIGLRVPAQPLGAFYIYADTTDVAADSYRLAWDLMEHAGVGVTPGLDFGDNAPERHLRFAYTTSRAELEQGIARIDRFLRAGG